MKRKRRKKGRKEGENGLQKERETADDDDDDDTTLHRIARPLHYNMNWESKTVSLYSIICNWCQFKGSYMDRIKLCDRIFAWEDLLHPAQPAGGHDAACSHLGDVAQLMRSLNFMLYTKLLLNRHPNP